MARLEQDVPEVAVAKKKRNKGDVAGQKRRWRNKNRRRLYLKYREAIIKRAMAWKKANPERALAIQREFAQRSKDGLSDDYVRKTFGWALAPVIPASLVEAKRELLRLQRELKVIENEKC